MIPRLLEAALGVWLMLAPAVLSYGPPAAHNDRIVGPVLAAAALIAVWEIARPLRHLNLLLGVWLLVAPFLLAAPFDATANSLGSGFAAILLSRLGGIVAGDFAGGWSSLWPPGRAVGESQQRTFGGDGGGRDEQGERRNR